MNNQQQSDAEWGRVSNLRDQSFHEAYSVHDVGERLFSDRCLRFGLQAFNHGDDRRDEDVHSGTGVDMGVEHRPNAHEYGTTVGWGEIKTKQNVRWMGRLNKEHWKEYRGFATYVDEDVFVFFCHVTDVDSNEVNKRYFVRVPPMDEDDIAVTLPFESKGHELVSVHDEDIQQHGNGIVGVEKLGWPAVIGSFFDTLARK